MAAPSQFSNPPLVKFLIRRYSNYIKTVNPGINPYKVSPTWDYVRSIKLLMPSSSQRPNVACFDFQMNIFPCMKLQQIYRLENKTEHRFKNEAVACDFRTNIMLCICQFLITAWHFLSFMPVMLVCSDHIPVLKKEAIMGAWSQGNDDKEVI